MDCLTAKGAFALAFLWRAHAQSGFTEDTSLGEYNATTSRAFYETRLTFFIRVLVRVPLADRFGVADDFPQARDSRRLR